MSKKVKHHLPSFTRLAALSPQPSDARNEKTGIQREPVLETLLKSLERLEGASVEILLEAGCPKIAELKLAAFPSDLELMAKIESLGFGWESKEGYSLRIFYLIRWLRAVLAIPEMALVYGIELGIELGSLISEAGMHSTWEVGVSVREGGRKGAGHWGSPRERVSEKDRLRQLFEKERRSHASNTKTYEAIARREGVSAHTVRRAVKGH
jgi:hypothetical protein